jgi:TM2 domain-containing membrane protein YozV
MKNYELALMSEMSDNQRLLFQNEVAQTRKSPTTAFVLALFLGGLGAHRFYMRDYWLGLLYVVFCWTFVPVVIALIELFFIGERVAKYNLDKATEIAQKLRTLSPASRPQPA